MKALRSSVSLALLLFSPARAESAGALRFWLGTGYDSNAKRDFVKPGDPNSEVVAEPDAVLSAIGSAEGLWQGEAAQLGGSYDLGLRKFLRLPSEDVLIQSASLSGSVALGSILALGVDARAKDRRGGDRDYTDLSAQGYLEMVPDSTVDVRIYGSGHRFLYWNRIAYAFAATEAGFTARYKFDKRHSAFVFADFALRTYQANANHRDPDPDDPNPPPPPPEERRHDQVLAGGAGYTFRGPFTLTLTYGYTEQASNSFGETTLRHRVTASAGFRLPWRVTLLAQLAAQYARYPDGVYLSDELNITEDDDSHNSVSLKLVRPVSEHLDLELRYALYQDALPANGYLYLRQVGWVGLSWRM